MKNHRLRGLAAWLLVLLLLTGCSTPAEPAAPADSESSESTFTAAEPEAASDASEGQTGDSAIVLTQAALAETDWMSMDTPEGRFDLPVNDALLEALAFENWEPVGDVTDAIEVFRFAVGTGEIVINEGSAYLLTDHGMDWYLTDETVVANLMGYMEDNFTMSARSTLFNDEYMFAQYYYDTIASLGNLDSFDGHGPLVQEMVKYAWFRYTYENSEATVGELYDDETGDFIFTKAMAFEEAKRYFDFDEAASDLSAMDLYDAERQGFTFWYSGPDVSDRSDFQNPWGYGYGGLKEIGDERYEIRLIDYMDSSQGIINKTNVYEISFDAEGNLKFDRGYEDVPSYELADAAPGLEKIEILREYESMGGDFLGETDKAYYFIMDDGEWTSYFKLDKATLEMTTVYAPDMAEEEYSYRVEQHGEAFFFYTNLQVLVTDGDWNLMESVAYPEAIVEGMESQWSYGDSVYFGEALSDDRSMFAYVDEEGLKLYTIETGETKLIKAKEGEGDVTEAIWCLNPRFADHDRKIVTARTRDYDSGFYLYDLESKEEKTVGGYIMPGKWLIAGDRGFFFSTKVDAYFYDFETGEIKDLPVQARGPEVYNEGFVLCNQDYAAYFDVSENSQILTLLDLETWSVVKTAPIQDVSVSMMYLDQNGDVGVNYSFTYTNFGSAIMRNK